MTVKKIGIISLSRGLLGEEMVNHEIKIGLNRLQRYPIDVSFLPNAQKGIDYLRNNPQKRAEDLLMAFKDPTIDMILCAIGGDDTYRLLPYLFANDQLKKVVSEKIFLGFSDTTMNHFMLHKLGLKTFYGQAFLPDICELSSDMLPYSRSYFDELLTIKQIKEIRPSQIWYQGRIDFSKAAIGVSMPHYKDRGFELLRGEPIFEGKILGGCLDSIYDMFDNSRYDNTVYLCQKFQLFPSLEEWKGKILLLETSEENPSPKKYRTMIKTLEDFGIFNVINGLLIGKPQNENHYGAYKKILLEEIDNKKLPIIYNINIGHATPRCIMPFGVQATVDVTKQVIQFNNE
ncbi:hypothetical protein HMPREF9318_00914 [Streptococcus urinalis FB127-CNA-2]|uniref:LD-carboxypeptidase n=1 Tax=Streptococcus urinalis 2285-97 TaxID=764291 RepID=G5KGP8_9STRE|nr:S66 peptidase family protein [Streptococcus urinalis]EHJ56836.1 LD-carboxypeptidase [Streptococcus urinalis 2285-97]EKS20960.1 hypothetical protein HMPREF9318_00914 [Streptococcus urinalis FB127-CNA-2]VEF30969.1 MccC family protein [Streptococcus urinalis]